MKLKRIKNGQKIKWKKGHSCVTNPETTKFRDAAKGNFFKTGESGLTEEALAKHDAAVPDPELCADADDDKTIGRSCKTFATNFTTCTIPAFETFFKNFTIESNLQRSMLEVHAAAQEFLREENLPETATSYMTYFMYCINDIKDNKEGLDEDHITGILSLLAKVIRKVDKNVLRKEFGLYAKTLGDLLTVYSNTINAKLLINVIGCISVLLRAQYEEQWTYPSTKNLFFMIISFSTHENSEIRKTAQYNVSAVLKGSSFLDEKKMKESDDDDNEMNVDESEESKEATAVIYHPAAVDVWKFIETNLKLASENKNGNATLYLLIFLQSIINSLPEKVLMKCCTRVVEVMQIGNGVIKSRSFKVLGSFFSVELNQQFDSAETLEIVEGLVNVLTSSTLKLIPGMNNPELSILWMETVSLGIIRISRKDKTLGIDHFNSWMKLLTLFWKSDLESVHEKVFYEIDHIFDECVIPLKEEVTSYTPVLLQSFSQVEKCLSLQYESAWPFVFRTLSIYFSVLGRHCTSEMIPCLKNLANLAETKEVRGKKQLEFTIGAAINGMGPEAVMNVVPLEITGKIRQDEVHFWILPILKKFVKETRLAFFVSKFVPLANKCYVIIKSLNDESCMMAKIYRQIERQIWALLPSFANVAVDIEEALTVQVHAVDIAAKNDFSTQIFVQLIGKHINNNPETRLDFLAALRNMLKSSSAKVFAKYGKNLIPILLNLYLKKPRDKFPKLSPTDVIDSGQRLAAFTTIKEYLPVLEAKGVYNFFNMLLNKIDAESADMFKKKSLFNLIIPFIPNLDDKSPEAETSHEATNLLETIFNKTKIYIETKNSNFQKSAYTILKNILCAETVSSKEFISNNVEEIGLLLMTSLNNVVPNARAARLKCLLEFLQIIPSDIPVKKRKPFFKQLIQEAVQYCGRNNSTVTRKSAFLLMGKVVEAVQRIKKVSFDKSYNYCFELMPCLDPPSDITANTILALMALSYLYDDKLDIKIGLRCLPHLINLLSSNKRDIIKSCLGFIRVIFSKYSPVILNDFVDDLVRNIVRMPLKDRCKFRLKIRDIFASLIRKFGTDRIKELVPEKDSIHKMFINIVKKDNRKKRATKDEEESDDEEVATEAPASLDQVLEELDREIENDNESKMEKRKKLKEKESRKKKKKNKLWIKEEEDEIIDLLDLSATHNITSKKPQLKQLRFEEKAPQTDEEKYGFRVDRRTNKFVITEKWVDREIRDEDEDEDDDSDFMALDDLAGVLPKKEKKNVPQTKKRKRTQSETSINSEEPSNKYEAGTSQERPKVKRKFDYGSEFRAKKAGGDVTKKGGIAPYAYVQLSRDKLNRRKKAKYAGQFRSLVKGGKKGAIKGSKSRSKKH